MKLTSTRNKDINIPFAKAVLDCMPGDGGLYVPSEILDLRRWTLYCDERTTFTSIAGTMTSAFLNEEFSPIICEKIATTAFPFSPVVKQLDEGLFMMELFHGWTGCHRDFGVSYICACIETILAFNGGNAVFLDFTHGELGAALAKALKGKKHIKAVLVYREGDVRGLSEEDYVWNGGNIYPVEVAGNENDCKNMIREIFADKKFVSENHLTVANTANIGRLLPHVFYYPYAFSKIKNKVHGDIFYALSPGNYSNLVAGLYSWKFALPLNGFILPSTSGLTTDTAGNTLMMDSFVEINKRLNNDPSDPSNLERLEELFTGNGMLMGNFVYPSHITNTDIDNAAKELFMKYHVFADKSTSKAYAAALQRKEEITEDEGAIVLIARDDPSIQKEFCRHTVGEMPKMSESLELTFKPSTTGKTPIHTSSELRNIIEKVNLN